MADWLHQALSAGRILVKNSFEGYMDRFLQSKLDLILQEHHLVSLITQLRGKDSSKTRRLLQYINSFLLNMWSIRFSEIPASITAAMFVVY